VVACALVVTLGVSMSAAASDREAGPRDPGNRSAIARILHFIIQAFGDLSFPPPQG
jgi:hypothetical protein